MNPPYKTDSNDYVIHIINNNGSDKNNILSELNSGNQSKTKKHNEKKESSPKKTNKKQNNLLDSPNNQIRKSSQVYPFPKSKAKTSVSSCFSAKKVESLDNFDYKTEFQNEEKPKKTWISNKTEGIINYEKNDQKIEKIEKPPLKTKKVEGLLGLENQILHEIKINSYNSLKKELVDLTEESHRNSNVSDLEENQKMNKLLEKFMI